MLDAHLSRFNPHPPVGAGATSSGLAAWELPARSFQSSPARGGGCNARQQGQTTAAPCVSILTRPWGRVQPDWRETSVYLKPAVSILTRPWGRVQQIVQRGRIGKRIVSILTRPWGRVQPVGRWLVASYPSRFQSSPARGGGCNRSGSTDSVMGDAFQSSPARGGGCNRCTTTSARRACSSFNPHPPVGAGATSARPNNRQSVGVSILTRPWGRVQPKYSDEKRAFLCGFQSSPARGGGCNGATRRAWGNRARFQSSPARGGGCNAQRAARRRVVF